MVVVTAAGPGHPSPRSCRPAIVVVSVVAPTATATSAARVRLRRRRRCRRRRHAGARFTPRFGAKPEREVVRFELELAADAGARVLFLEGNEGLADDAAAALARLVEELGDPDARDSPGENEE